MPNIVRVEHNRDKPYVMLSRKEVTENESLSYGARGLLAYLLSKPDDWQVRMKDLVNSTTDGRQGVRSMFKELDEAGFIKRIKSRNEKTGRWDYDTTVYETPNLEAVGEHPSMATHRRESTGGDGGAIDNNQSPSNQSPNNHYNNPPTEARPKEQDPMMKLLDHSGVIIGSELQKEKWYDLLEITDDIQLIKEAFEAAASQNKRPTPSYIRAILERCLKQGLRPDEWPDRDKKQGGDNGNMNIKDAIKAFKEGG